MNDQSLSDQIGKGLDDSVQLTMVVDNNSMVLMMTVSGGFDWQ